MKKVIFVTIALNPENTHTKKQAYLYTDELRPDLFRASETVLGPGIFGSSVVSGLDYIRENPGGTLYEMGVVKGNEDEFLKEEN